MMSCAPPGSSTARSGGPRWPKMTAVPVTPVTTVTPAGPDGNGDGMGTAWPALTST